MLLTISKILLLSRIARRNVWRNPKRSFLTLCAIALGIWSAVCISAFMRGLNSQMIKDSINNLTGHLQIHHSKYLDDPVIENSIAPLPANLREQLLNDPNVEGFSERVRVPAVVMSERDTAGVTMIGIDPVRERNMSFVADSIVSGRFIDSKEDIGVVIGQALADQLQTEIGKRIVLMGEDKSNDVADRGFIVAGIFNAKLEATEKSYVFVGISTAQKMLGLGEDISEVAIKVTDDEFTQGLVEKLAKSLPEVDIQPWQVLEPLTVAVVTVQSGFLKLWYLIVCIAIAFGLVNTLFMAIFERTREIGMLKSLGLKPSGVLAQISIESGFILLWGIIVGNLIAFGTVHLFSSGIDLSSFSDGLARFGFSKVVYPTIFSFDVILSNCIIFFIALLSSIYPAWRGAKLSPLEALRGSN